MNIITSRGLRLGAGFGAVGLLTITAAIFALSMKAPARAALSCPSYLKVSAAATCGLEYKRSVGRASAMAWKIYEPSPAGDDDGTYRRELVMLEGQQLRFSAPVEQLLEGAQDQELRAGALSTQALSEALGAPALLLTNQQSGSGGYLNMFLIMDTPQQARVHTLAGSRNLKAMLVEGQLRFEDWDSAWGELERDYRPAPGQSPKVIFALRGGELRADAQLMRTPAPTMQTLQAMAAKATAGELHQQLGALIYAGHQEVAWDYLAWVGPKLGLDALQIKQRRLDIEEVLNKSEHSALIKRLQAATTSPFVAECAPYRRFKRTLELIDSRRVMQAQLELEQLAHEPMPCHCKLQTEYSEDAPGHALYEIAGQLGLQLTLVLEPEALKRLGALEHRVNMPPSAAREVLDLYTDYPLLNAEQRCEHMLKQLGPGSDALLELSMPGLGAWRDQPRRWLCPTLVPSHKP